MGNNKARIYYDNPASEWVEALPIGNGRLGAMVFGRISEELIQMNEDSIWLGGYEDRNNKKALENLPKLRKLLMNDEIKKAEELLKEAFSGTPCGMKPYQPLGNLLVDFLGKIDESKITDYCRELDLENAVATTSFSFEGVTYKREVFSSFPDKCMFVRISASEGKNISFDASVTRGKEYSGIKQISDDTLYLYGKLGENGMDFGVCVKAVTKGGTVSTANEKLEVRGADEVLLVIDGGSTFRYECLEKELYSEACASAEKSFDILLERHIKDYQSLFNRVSFELECEKNPYEDLPTDKRLAAFKELDEKGETETDLGFYVLYFNFGRYLMISGSRPGSLPLNLQGIWNDSFTPAWDSKFTININAEMNYWPAEVCNLSECHLPLFDLMKRMEEHGKETAKVMYGCRGIVAHHNTNIWGDTAPQDQWIPGTYWVMGFAWLCTHIWTHYQYTNDTEFLRDNYHLMVEASEFFLDFLIEDKEGFLVTCPSVSPENTFIIDKKNKGCNTYGVTMDNMILRDLFTQCIKASDILGQHDEVIDRIQNTLGRLHPTSIGKYGQIMEWPKDYEEEDPGHRHISQLYGLFPSNQISVKKTPDLAAAAAKTLERRLGNGGGHTGWSRAWIINNYAKLHDGENALEHLNKIISKSTLPNLFDNHPPFQIDGNFGATAAIANMLVQSDEDGTEFLPALPKQWKSGRIRGLKVIGGKTVDFAWKDGKICEKCYNSVVSLII